MKKIAVALWMTAVFFAGTAMSYAAETVHLYLKGAKTASFNPGNPNGVIEVQLDWPTKSAREAASGQATGKRQYEPIMFRKRIDKSSPLLAKALAENQTIEVLKFAVGKPMKGGKFKVKEIVTLVNPKLTKITKGEPGSRYAEYEEIAFTFSSIKRQTVNKIMSDDDWPVGGVF